MTPAVLNFLRGRRHPALIGVVHLGALPGAPRYGGDLPLVLERAVADALAIAEGGGDAIIVENFGDIPFRRDRVDPETVAAMALATARVQRAVGELAVGVNVLRNDARAALGLCAATGAEFLRVNVHCGAAVADQGLLEGRADETLRERARLGLACAILADVHVKHAEPLAGGTIADAARDALRRGLADGLVVSGAGTGEAADPAALEAVRQACPEAPLLLGSGLSLENAGDYRRLIDAAIVGTSIKLGGRVDRPVDPERVAALCSALAGRP
ncbi:BtpA/SgcQ family protein [Engelhardtia mirabilis]|uniref:Sgc region protein SgcQ n=1 Tax=Engelhardtia mirabilis TaxID=2528011 RepID=A0A518BN27_9BACT|nr:Putative sgc region protein SgcQ [Planctomycetes bacterium Pla133]QDV02715.1 Putative sgc region protein SgcQ [Planctomycetes bacterium Pla86]